MFIQFRRVFKALNNLQRFVEILTLDSAHVARILRI